MDTDRSRTTETSTVELDNSNRNLGLGGLVTPRPKKREKRPMTNNEHTILKEASAFLSTAAYHLSVDAMFDSEKALHLIAKAMQKLAHLSISSDAPCWNCIEKANLADAIERYAAESNLDFRGHADIEGGEHA